MIATLWTLTWHFGIGGLGILAALVFAFYSPVFKKTALMVAAGIGLGLACYTAGVVNENAYWQAKWDRAASKIYAQHKKARDRASASVQRGVRDPRDTDGRKK